MVSHIYFHIPYCADKCSYCDFYSEYPKQAVHDTYIEAIQREVNSRYFGEKLTTVYFGGGTPSLLNGTQVNSILKQLNLSTDAEVTIECNPETITIQKLEEFVQFGINRISIGVQSFDAQKLKAIGRKRDVNVLDTIELSSKIFDNIGIDLMYALPNQEIEDIALEVNQIPNAVKHISYYALTMEENTKFFNKHKGVHPVLDEKQADLGDEVVNLIEQKGFMRYEISNFAKHGYKSRHNLAYWNYENYLGIGAGAVSTIDGVRVENSKSIEQFIEGKNVSEHYLLTEIEKTNEKLMMQMRTTYGTEVQARFQPLLEKYPDLLSLKEGRVQLTKKGFMLFNEIVSEMML